MKHGSNATYKNPKEKLNIPTIKEQTIHGIHSPELGLVFAQDIIMCCIKRAERIMKEKQLDAMINPYAAECLIQMVKDVSKISDLSHEEFKPEHLEPFISKEPVCLISMINISYIQELRNKPHR